MKNKKKFLIAGGMVLVAAVIAVVAVVSVLASRTVTVEANSITVSYSAKKIVGDLKIGYSNFTVGRTDYVEDGEEEEDSKETCMVADNNVLEYSFMGSENSSSPINTENLPTNFVEDKKLIVRFSFENAEVEGSTIASQKWSSYNVKLTNDSVLNHDNVTVSVYKSTSDSIDLLDADGLAVTLSSLQTDGFKVGWDATNNNVKNSKDGIYVYFVFEVTNFDKDASLSGKISWSMEGITTSSRRGDGFDYSNSDKSITRCVGVDDVIYITPNEAMTFDFGGLTFDGDDEDDEYDDNSYPLATNEILLLNTDQTINLSSTNFSVSRTKPNFVDNGLVLCAGEYAQSKAESDVSSEILDYMGNFLTIDSGTGKMEFDQEIYQNLYEETGNGMETGIGVPVYSGDNDAMGYCPIVDYDGRKYSVDEDLNFYLVEPIVSRSVKLVNSGDETAEFLFDYALDSVAFMQSSGSSNYLNSMLFKFYCSDEGFDVENESEISNLILGGATPGFLTCTKLDDIAVSTEYATGVTGKIYFMNKTHYDNWNTFVKNTNVIKALDYNVFYSGTASSSVGDGYFVMEDDASGLYRGAGTSNELSSYVSNFDNIQSGSRMMMTVAI